MDAPRPTIAPRGRTTCALVAAACAMLLVPTPATGDPELRSAGVWLAVSDHKLDDLRGGFDPGNGLLVSFGISRVVYINGDLVTQTTLDFGRLTDLTPAQATQISKQLASLNLVQNGPGNSFQPQQNGTSFGTVIQNTLDNQHIVNETVINATSNAAGMIKNLNMQSTINDGIARAVGSR